MNEKNIEIVKNKGETLAIIISSGYRSEGVKFFTPDDFSQQLAFISRKKGETIQAHKHNAVKRDVYFTQEVLVIRSGKLKVNFYDSKRQFFDCRILSPGDVILLAGGGHGFEFLENTEMIEIKQGPYLKEEDKTRFEGAEGK
jgi:mannose-6-phosphate isomerase-like protein (cupin superfamily)